MGCNNTFTDGQRQAMFATTDEEMQYIEQRIDWPIERTQQKSKKYVRFFFNETAFKQHHFELPFKKKKSPHCAKAINHTNNLEKHLRSCERAPTNPARRQLRQKNLDGPTSFKNRHSTPKKLMVDEVQMGVHLSITLNIRRHLK